MDLICVEGEKRLVADLTTDSAPTLGDLSYGEVQSVRIAKVRRTTGATSGNRWAPVDISTSALRAAVGPTLTAPTSGTFSIKWGGDQQGPLNYNVTAAQLGTALASIPALISDGGVTVSDQGNGLFYITFLTVGDKALFTIEDNALVPDTVAEITVVRAGNGSTQQIQAFRLVQLPAVKTSTFTATSAPTVTITELQTGAVGVNHIIRVSFGNSPYAGYWTLTFVDFSSETTRLIPYVSTGDEVEQILKLSAAVGVDGDLAPNVDVQRNDDGSYTIQFISNLEATDMGTITGSGAALQALTFMAGTLDLRDADLGRLLGSSTSVATFLEIEETPSGGAPIKLLRDQINLVAPVLNVA